MRMGVGAAEEFQHLGGAFPYFVHEMFAERQADDAFLFSRESSIAGDFCADNVVSFGDSRECPALRKFIGGNALQFHALLGCRHFQFDEHEISLARHIFTIAGRADHAGVRFKQPSFAVARPGGDDMCGIADPIAIMLVEPFQEMRLQTLFIAYQSELCGRGFHYRDERYSFHAFGDHDIDRLAALGTRFGFAGMLILGIEFTAAARTNDANHRYFLSLHFRTLNATM